MIGSLYRRVIPVQDEPFYRKTNAAESRLAGRWVPLHTQAEQRYIKREDGSDLRILVVRTRNQSAFRPGAAGLLWIHGGGYAMGIPETDHIFVDMFCTEGECISVMPDYTRSMDSPYPAAVDDCVTALYWMADHAEELGIDPGRIFVGGDSAGGGLTAATCLRARDEGRVNVAFQMPLYPMLDDRDTESNSDNDAPVWNTRSNRIAWDIYLAGKRGAEDVPYYAAPARAEDLKGMPPAATFVGGIDPFLSETREYINKLRRAGVPAFYREFPGCFHAFDVAALISRPAREAREFIKGAFRYALDNYRAENR